MSSTDTTTAPRFYCVAVKGSRGRKWFAADSSRSASRELIEGFAADCAARFPELRFAAMDERDVPTLAPKHYRPWDTEPDESDDVDLDSLGDDEL
jgi:hypothetical protein